MLCSTTCNSRTGKRPRSGSTCYATALIISIFCIFLTLCAAIDNPIYRWIRTLPFAVKLTVSILVEAVLLGSTFVVERTSSRRLLKREVLLEVFRSNERRFSVLRGACYIRALATLVTAMAIESLRKSICFGAVALIDVIPFVYCVYHTVLRGSFRKYPSMVVALSGGVLYVALLTLPYPLDSLLGFLDGTVVYGVITRLATYLTTGLIVVALVGVAGILGQKSIDRMYTSEVVGNSDKWDNFKRLRMRLLTHLWTHPQDLTERICHCYVILALFAVAASISVFAPLFMVANSEETSFSFFLGILGTGFLFLGVILYFNVFDENLMKAEYSYVCLKLLHLHKTSVQQKDMRWKDYCQVVSNVYCSRAGISSEEDFLQALWEPALKDLSKQTGVCEAHLMLCLVQAHQRTAQMYLSNHDKPEPEDNERLAVDLVRHTFHENRATEPAEQTTFDGLIRLAFYCLLKYSENSWERRFQKLGLSLEKAKAILYVDIMNFYLCKQPESISDCRIRMLCKRSANGRCICGGDYAQENQDVEVSQKVFLLSFPATLYNCIRARWGDNDLSDDCWEGRDGYGNNFEEYYTALYESGQDSVSDMKTLTHIFEQWFMEVYPLRKSLSHCVLKSLNRIQTAEKNKNTARIADINDEIGKISLSGFVSMSASKPAENVPVEKYMKLVFFEFYKNNTPEG